MAREGGSEWYQSIGLYSKYSTFPPILKNYLKDPGSLNSKKRFWAAKQLYEERHTIKGRPGLKTGKKQNRGAPYFLILHDSACRRIKVTLLF